MYLNSAVPCDRLFSLCWLHC